MARELPEGIRKETHHGKIGYRALQWVPWWPGYPDGRLLSKRFPITTPIPIMVAWREDQKVDARRRQTAREPLPIVVTGFAEDAERYLEARTTMAQFEQRKYHIRMWVSLFGERDHKTIEPVEILRQREEWLTRGPKWIHEKGKRVLRPLPLSPSEVNLRLRALQNLWTTMYPTEKNVVREVPEATGTGAKARGQSFGLAREILRYMPDVTVAKAGELPEKGSLSRIRFEAMLYTGLTNKQIGMLTEAAVDWDGPSVVPPLRDKGRTSKRGRPRRVPRARPLLPTAVPVLRKLFAMGANKPFSKSSFGRTIRRAVAAANVARAKDGLPLLDATLRPYDWTRHTFGTEVYRHTGDLKMVQELLGHGDISQSEIYAQSAVREHVRAAIVKVEAAAADHPRPGGRPRAGRLGKVQGKETVPPKGVSVRTPRLVKRQNPQ